MKFEQRDKNLLGIALLAILFYFAVLRIDRLTAALGKALSLIKPFIIGGVIAFVINLPMVKIEKELEKTKLKKSRRPVAFVLTLAVILAVVSAFLLIIIPQLAQTVMVLIDHLQIFFSRVPGMIAGLDTELGFVQEYIDSLNINWQDLGAQIITWLQDFALSLLNSGSGMVSGLVSGFTTGVLAVIFAVYLLLGKEKNARALKRLTVAIMGEKHSGSLFHVLSIAHRSFSNFLSGQCLEAVILGAMFAVAMAVFRLPYALLTGMVIAVTALIPVFGAFIGCAVGVVLIAIESPVQAVWFVVLFLVLQQIEGNIIYPRVVGNKVGLPSILVFMSVILGSSLMGVAGMLIFIPSVSVIYSLVKEFVEKKEALRQPPQPAEEK